VTEDDVFLLILILILDINVLSNFNNITKNYKCCHVLNK